MDTRYENYFYEIAKRGNLSHAAEYLHVAQSTLSQYLQRQEREIGLQLFTRGKGGLKLTLAGELYMKACIDIINTKDALYKRLAEIAQSQFGMVRFGITPQWGARVMSIILPLFMQDYPDYIVKMTEDTSPPLLKQLAEGTVDMAKLALTDTPDVPFPLIFERREEIVLAVSSSVAEKYNLPSRRSGYPSLDFSILRHEPFIIARERTVHRQIIDDIFRSSNFTPQIVCEINNMQATRDMVACGFGISIFQQSEIEVHKNIRYFRLDPHRYWKIVILKRKEYEMTKADMHLVSLIRNYYEQLSAREE